MPNPKTPAQVRCFVAANLNAGLLDKIKALQQTLARKLLSDANQVRWTAPGQVHLTLRFFGNVAIGDLEALTAALGCAVAGIGSMRLSLRTLGCFPSWQRPSVIWVGVQGEVESLSTLQARIEAGTKSCGSHSEDRAFHPHLTIGRVRTQGTVSRNVGEALKAEASVELGEWVVDEVVLIRSQLSSGGSIYTPLANFKLQSS